MNFNFIDPDKSKISVESNNPNNNQEIKVYITNVYEGDVASKVRGYFVIDEEKIRFSSIAFGRIGGHNVSLSIAKKSEQLIRKKNLDPEMVQIIIQRKLIEGDVVFPPNIDNPNQ